MRCNLVTVVECILDTIGQVNVIYTTPCKWRPLLELRTWREIKSNDRIEKTAQLLPSIQYHMNKNCLHRIFNLKDQDVLKKKVPVALAAASALLISYLVQ
jgi:hypothetical protein